MVRSVFVDLRPRLNFRKLSFALAAVLSLAMPAHADTEIPGYEEEAPDAIVSYQRKQYDDPDKTDLEIITVIGESSAAILNAYERAVETHSPYKSTNPYANSDMVGVFHTAEDVQEAEAALSTKKLGADKINFFEWKSVRDTRTKVTTSSLKKSANRRPAGNEDPVLSRLELLAHYKRLKASNPGIQWKWEESVVNNKTGDIRKVTTGYREAGEKLVDEVFNKSARRKIFVAVRATAGGVGTYVGMAMSNVDPILRTGMAGVAATCSGVIQAKISKLGRFLTNTNKAEVNLFNMVFRPMTLFKRMWKGQIGAKSSELAFILKWFLTEYVVNQVNRLAGWTISQMNPGAKQWINGVEQIRPEFMLAEGFESSVDISIRTLATQGVYEKIVMGEYVKRTQPYYELVGYYTELLKTTTDPATIAEIDLIIRSCMKHGISEQTARASLTTIGTISWIGALALESHPNKLYSQISSWSLLGVGGGLQVYYTGRAKYEERALSKLMDTESERLKKALLATVQDICASNVRKVNAWAKDFNGDIKRTKFMGGPTNKAGGN